MYSEKTRNKSLSSNGLMRAGNGLFSKDRSGIAAIEFAMILPVFVMLTIATVNLGHVFFVNHSMQRIAGETMRAVTYGELGMADAKKFADAELQDLVGDFNVDIKLLPNGTEVEVNIIAQTAASNLIDFPFANVALVRPELAVSLTNKVITRFDPAI